MGYGVFHISSLVSPLIGGGYWAVFPSPGVSIMSPGLGGRMPRTRLGGPCSVVTRRISLLAGVDGVVWFGLGLHGASKGLNLTLSCQDLVPWPFWTRLFGLDLAWDCLFLG